MRKEVGVPATLMLLQAPLVVLGKWVPCALSQGHCQAAAAAATAPAAVVVLGGGPHPCTTSALAFPKTTELPPEATAEEVGRRRVEGWSEPCQA